MKRVHETIVEQLQKLPVPLSVAQHVIHDSGSTRDTPDSLTLSVFPSVKRIPRIHAKPVARLCLRSFDVKRGPEGGGRHRFERFLRLRA